MCTLYNQASVDTPSHTQVLHDVIAISDHSDDENNKAGESSSSKEQEVYMYTTSHQFTQK
jgi:hypothetical protein